MPVICAADIAYPYNAAVADSSSGSGSVAPETPIDYVPNDVAVAFAPGHAKRPKTSTTRAREDSPERTSDAKKAVDYVPDDVAAAFAPGHAKRPKTPTTRAREDSPERTSDAKKAAWESSGDAFASSHAAPSAQEEDRTMAQC